MTHRTIRGPTLNKAPAMSSNPPNPFDPDFPRYLPLEPFPDYRHVPGTNMEIQGRFGHTEDPIVDLPGPDAWRDNTDYLFGVDLFNHAYWYEAHAIWNPLWHRATGNYRLFINGLAMVSDALLMHHQRDLRGLRDQMTQGTGKLTAVLNAEGDVYMGLNLHLLMRSLDTFISPFFEENIEDSTYENPASFPLLRLVF